jgi:hypothetical protein
MTDTPNHDRFDAVILDGTTIDPQNYHDVLSRDDKPYKVGIEDDVLSVAGTTREPRDLHLSAPQLIIARYALDHIGEEFRKTDIDRSQTVPLPKSVFNEAVFERELGLWPFFNMSTTPNMVWYKDHTTHQLGVDMSTAEEHQAEAQRETSDIEPLLTGLSDEQRTVIHVLREIIPDNGLEEELALNELCERLPQFDRRVLEKLLHSSIHAIKNRNQQQPTLDFETRGRGTQARYIITMAEDLRPVAQNHTQTDQPEKEPSQDNGRLEILPNMIGPTSGKLPYSEADKQSNRHIDWKIDRDRFIVNGEEVYVLEDGLYLIDCIRRCGLTPTRLSSIARMFDSNLSDQQFKRFVVWANIIIDGINQIAPVVAIDNLGNPDRRHKYTTYTFNFSGQWTDIRKFVPGRSLNPKRFMSNPDHS